MPASSVGGNALSALTTGSLATSAGARSIRPTMQYAIVYAPIESLKLFYAYVDRVKRIFEPNDGAGALGSPAGPFAANFISKSHLFDVGFTFNEAVALFGYSIHARSRQQSNRGPERGRGCFQPDHRRKGFRRTEFR